MYLWIIMHVYSLAISPHLFGTLFYMYYYLINSRPHVAYFYMYIIVVYQLVLCLTGECFSKKRRRRCV